MKIKYYQVGDRRYTLHQLQILSKLRDGLVHKEIAVEMGISKGTVDHSVADCFHKKGFKNSKEQVSHASEHGLQYGGYFKGKNLFSLNGKKPRKEKLPPKKK